MDIEREEKNIKKAFSEDWRTFNFDLEPYVIQKAEWVLTLFRLFLCKLEYLDLDMTEQ